MISHFFFKHLEAVYRDRYQFFGIFSPSIDYSVHFSGGATHESGPGSAGSHLDAKQLGQDIVLIRFGDRTEKDIAVRFSRIADIEDALILFQRIISQSKDRDFPVINLCRQNGKVMSDGFVTYGVNYAKIIMDIVHIYFIVQFQEHDFRVHYDFMFLIIRSGNTMSGGNERIFVAGTLVSKRGTTIHIAVFEHSDFRCRRVSFLNLGFIIVEVQIVEVDSFFQFQIEKEAQHQKPRKNKKQKNVKSLQDITSFLTNKL